MSVMKPNEIVDNGPSRMSLYRLYNEYSDDVSEIINDYIDDYIDDVHKISLAGKYMDFWDMCDYVRKRMMDRLFIYLDGDLNQINKTGDKQAVEELLNKSGWKVIHKERNGSIFRHAFLWLSIRPYVIAK